MEGTRLFMQATGQGPAEAFPLSETRFFFRVADAQIEFTIGDGGRATALTLLQGGMRCRRDGWSRIGRRHPPSPG